VQIEFDPVKDRINREKHGISLVAAADIDLDSAIVVEDRRIDYGETRFIAYGPIKGRLYVFWFTMRGDVLRAIGQIVGKGSGMANRDKKPADVSPEVWASVDVPEATDAEFATAKAFKQVFPAQYKSWKKKKMGPPPVATPKVHIGFRLAADVVDAVRASGRGYNARVEKVLRDALAKGEL